MLSGRMLLCALRQDALGVACVVTVQFGRTPMDWDSLSNHRSSCSFVFGQGDHWGPVALYHEVRCELSLPRAWGGRKLKGAQLLTSTRPSAAWALTRAQAPGSA